MPEAAVFDVRRSAALNMLLRSGDIIFYQSEPLTKNSPESRFCLFPLRL